MKPVLISFMLVSFLVFLPDKILGDKIDPVRRLLQGLQDGRDDA